jgi:hypothetical protein
MSARVSVKSNCDFYQRRSRESGNPGQAKEPCTPGFPLSRERRQKRNAESTSPQSALALSLTPALLVALLAAPALADENKDLELIPESVQQAPPVPAAEPTTEDLRQTLYLEDAFILDSLRHTPVPFPPPSPPNWQERLFFDARKEWVLASDLSLTYSGRLNLEAADEVPFPTHEAVRHDFREGFVSWQALPGNYLDLGRINLKNGVAAGFNPTDFFKTRAVVETLSNDPAVLREDRLGTFMLEGQHIGEGSAFSVAFAPKLYDPSRLYNSRTLPSLNPVLDRTNAHDRLLLKGGADLAEGVSPEFLLYHEGNRTEFGANYAHGVGQSTILYAEWAGGRRQSLIADALRYGVDTGTIPGNAPAVIPFDRRTHFQNDLAIGGSYTTPSKIVLNLEYHFHEAGFSRQDWRNWFAIGRAKARVAPVTQELWFIRAYAGDQQEPISIHSIFLRADWQDAFIPHLELSGFANVDLFDGSTFVQAEAEYALGDRWNLGAIASGNFGGRRTDDGSLPQAASLILKLARYF